MSKRIAMISEHASPLAHLGGVDSGGQNVYVAHLAQNLASQGYQVDVFTRCDDQSLPEIYEWKDGLRVVHVPAGPHAFVPKEELLGHMPAFTEFMIEFFKKQLKPYDIIHANFWMSGLVAADIKAALGIPFVITFHALGLVRRQHQGKEDGFPDQRFDYEKRIVREADGIVAECPQDRLDLIHFYEADPLKIREIPAGFDPQEFWPINKSLARLQIGVPEEEWVVLQLGRMVPRKGVDTAIHAFARLVKAEGMPARLVIVGGGSREPDPEITPEIGRLQKIAEEEGVLDKVLFTGRRDRQELKYYYSAADVFISTPWYEPFGITPIESMACGTPVIGASVGGIKHTVADGKTGFLVPPKDPQAVAERLAELYHNPEKRKRFSQQAVERVSERFTWPMVAKMVAEFYRDVLTEKTPELAGGNGNGSRYRSGKRTEESKIIYEGFASAMETLQHSSETLESSILEAADLILDCLDRGGKVMVCGNGGSAADAQHFTAELAGRFVSENRAGLPFLSLTADSAFLTAWSNDIGYEHIFSRQVEAFGKPGDLLVGISTSGRSKNIVEAFHFAQKNQINCLAILGGNGGDLLPLADAAVVVPAWNTQRIQEVQILVLHLLCELIEKHINEKRVESGLAIQQSTLEKSSGKLVTYSGLFSTGEQRRQR